MTNGAHDSESSSELRRRDSGGLTARLEKDD